MTAPLDYALQTMDVTLSPDQPDEVERALAGLLEPGPDAPDPWWQAGIDEALDT